MPKSGIQTFVVWGTLFAFFMCGEPLFAQITRGDIVLPAPGSRVDLSPAYHPPMLQGIKVYPQNPLRVDFLVDKGDLPLEHGQLSQESTTLIKYFLAGLTVPAKDLWVNLSPYEQGRIIPDAFGKTEMGRDLLAQDYLLKQLSASLAYPEGPRGKEFWGRIYAAASKRYRTTAVTVNTFNKVWIVPDGAVVYENALAGTAYVLEGGLKVLTEQDYLAGRQHHIKDSGQNGIVKDILIPALTKEINEGRNFARLRQVYNSLILANWYKNKLKGSALCAVYAGKNKVEGVRHPNTAGRRIEDIYQQYLRAYKKGVYNFIRNDVDPRTDQPIPRKYFSGGMAWQDMAMRTTDRIDRVGTGENIAVVETRLVPVSTAAAGLLKYSNRALGARELANNLEGTSLTAFINEAIDADAFDFVHFARNGELEGPFPSFQQYLFYKQRPEIMAVAQENKQKLTAYAISYSLQRDTADAIGVENIDVLVFVPQGRHKQVLGALAIDAMPAMGLKEYIQSMKTSQEDNLKDLLENEPHFGAALTHFVQRWQERLQANGTPLAHNAHEMVSTLLVGLATKRIHMIPFLRALKEMGIASKDAEDLLYEFLMLGKAEDMIDRRPDITQMDRVKILGQRRPFLSEIGLRYLDNLEAALAGGDQERVDQYLKGFPTVAEPHLEYFKPMAEPLTPQMLDDLQTIQITEGCSHACTHCFFAPSGKVTSMPFNRLIGILEEAKRLLGRDTLVNDSKIVSLGNFDAGGSMFDWLVEKGYFDGSGHELSGPERRDRLDWDARLRKDLEQKEGVTPRDIGWILHAVTVARGEPLNLYRGTEMFDYYDPLYDADAGDVMAKILAYFPKEEMFIRTRGWYLGDKIAERAARKIVALTRQYPGQVRFKLSLDLFDVRGDLNRYIVRMARVYRYFISEDKKEFSALAPVHPEQLHAFQQAEQAIIFLSGINNADYEYRGLYNMLSPVGRGKRYSNMVTHQPYVVGNTQYGVHILPNGRVLNLDLGHQDIINSAEYKGPADISPFVEDRKRFRDSGINLWMEPEQIPRGNSVEFTKNAGALKTDMFSRVVGKITGLDEAMSARGGIDFSQGDGIPTQKGSPPITLYSDSALFARLQKAGGLSPRILTTRPLPGAGAGSHALRLWLEHKPRIYN